MRICRLDLDGLGSPAALAARIHELEPQLSSRVPVDQLCLQLDIQSIGALETDGFEAAIIMDELKASGAILVAKGRSEERRRYSIAHELGHFLIPAHRPSGVVPHSNARWPISISSTQRTATGASASRLRPIASLRTC